MSVFREFLDLRSNVVIVFAGAFLVMFLIKLTSLLPEKYYFSFSSLYGGSSAEPFLIDPPGVAGKKFCEILKKNNIDVSALGQEEVNCSGKGEPFQYRFSKQQEDIIYSTALRSDVDARAKLRQKLLEYRLQPMSPEQFINMVRYEKDGRGVLERLQQSYGYQVSSKLREILTPELRSAYGALPEEPTRNVLKAQAAATQRLTNEQVNRLWAAHSNFVAGFNSTALASVPVPAILKSDIDGVIKYARTKESVVSGVAGIYTQPFGERAEAALEASFRQAGISLKKRIRKPLLNLSFLKKC